MWPIKSRAVGKADYNQEEKHADENKRIYHRGLVRYVNDLQSFKTERGDEKPTKALSLESTGMVSMQLLVNECGIPLEHVDVVSRNVRFAPISKSVKTGVLYFGELDDHLIKAHAAGTKYDAFVFDFCGVWFTQKHCVKRMFDLQLMSKYGFLSITCTFRNNTADYPEYMYHDYTKCEHDVMEWAKQNGYEAKANHRFYHYDQMFCLFFKVIHCKTTLKSKDRGKHTRTAMEWLQDHVSIPMPNLTTTTDPLPRKTPRRNVWRSSPSRGSLVFAAAPKAPLALAAAKTRRSRDFSTNKRCALESQLYCESIFY